MYKSPVEIIMGDVTTQWENGVLKAVQTYDVRCNKEELTKALAYDRNQYQKGYEDGKPKWIPCSERLPEADDVLCCDKHGSELIGWLHYDDYYDCWVCESDECVMYDTIAWMPLPEPYREETE